jgi:CheY-like chemotaxis protein
MLRQGPAPDVVIVDCALGEEDAARVAQAAREAGVARSLVLFSPFERLALAPATLGRFDGWLVKPVRSSSLLARLLDPGRNPAGTGLVPPAPAGRHPAVLLAEDNEINALVARKHLERLGAAVVHASDGADAVALAEMAARGERPPFDLMLLDLRMPRLDGLEAARRIRLIESESGAARARILALSASVFPDTGSACRAAGMDDVLAKPLDPAALASEIDRARERTKPGAT